MSAAKYQLIRSKRKTVALCVLQDLSVVVRAPVRMPKRDIDALVARHGGWIEKQTADLREQNERRIDLTDEQIQALKAKAKALLPQKVTHFSAVMKLNPASVKITSAQTRWGSCSRKNGLCFSYRLMLLPDELIDYIVVHELAHIKEKNHGAAFYALIALYMPDYKERVRRLKSRRNLPRG